ncbi:9777_t:CDS:2 [Entrophospora sp. SA101]|nr:9777_t:CDS:2 [Entrophospora sp. SA101]CAJ0878601.1 3377_t:CDS:2 [Entrophospora sp. SA101]
MSTIWPPLSVPQSWYLLGLSPPIRLPLHTLPKSTICARHSSPSMTRTNAI